MRLGNGTGSVYRLSGKRRNPYIVRKTVGWDVDRATGKAIQKYITIGYAQTKAKGVEMLMNYNQNPYDLYVVNITFAEVYKRWSGEKFSTISASNVNGYNASYKCCDPFITKFSRILG